MVRTLTLLPLLLLVAPPVARADDPALFEAKGSFVPASDPGVMAAIRVELTSRDDDLRISHKPAPRLRLAPAQRTLVLLDAKETGEVPLDPQRTSPAQPFRFPVTFDMDAPKRPHKVEATLSFVYCSTSKGWCRKGTTRLEIPVELH